MIRTLLLLALLLSLLLPPVVADEVVLKGGTRVVGVVLSRGEGGVNVLLRSGETLHLEPGDVGEVVADPEAPTAGKHVRFVEPKPGESGGLEAAVVHYVDPEGGPRVDLVSAVHIADAAFFREAQRVLDSAEVVLYEGIKPKDVALDEHMEEGGENPIRKIQKDFARWFDLTFQLEGIDYRRRHFVHADLTTEELAEEAGAEAGEAGGAGEPGKPGDGSLPPQLEQLEKMVKMVGPMLEAMIGKPGPQRDFWKTTIARMMGTADAGAVIGMMMPDLGELVLDRRNAIVVDRLKEWRKKAKRSIAVFYGAGHMKALEKTLVEDLGYRRAGGRWLRAWEIAPPAPKEK